MDNIDAIGAINQALGIAKHLSPPNIPNRPSHICL
jgi:hypothetical protein